jgi:undecaprenyl-diphosphatase
VLVPALLGWQIPQEDAFIFDVLVQVATLVAVFAYFWRDLVGIVKAFSAGIWQRRPFAAPQARLGWYLILASIPAGLAGLLFKDLVEQAFASPVATSAFLLLTAVLLILAERLGKRRLNQSEIGWQDALWIGVFQILALFPGVSRSGATITGGMLRNLDRPTAARFSFLMSIPVMLAAGLLAGLELMGTPSWSQPLPVFSAGFLVAAITGYLAIHWLLRFLTRYPLYGFAIYCSLAGIIGLVIFL